MAQIISFAFLYEIRVFVLMKPMHQIKAKEANALNHNKGWSALLDRLIDSLCADFIEENLLKTLYI